MVGIHLSWNYTIIYQHNLLKWDRKHNKITNDIKITILIFHFLKKPNFTSMYNIPEYIKPGADPLGGG